MRSLHISLLLGFGALMASSQSDLTLVRTTDLRGDTHHVQGIDFDERHVWVTSVDKAQRKGYLQEFSMATGEHIRTVDVAEGDRFHPGGISADGESLWVPVAEYRRDSSSVIQKRSVRTLELQYEFDVTDHIGCIAVAPEVLIGANWDSRDFYVWDHTGHLRRKVPNPTANAYQDIKFVDGRLVASGLLPDRKGAIDWLDYPSLRLIRRVTVGQTSRGVPYTSEGMAIRGDRILLLPEDSPSRLFQFSFVAPEFQGEEIATDIAEYRDTLPPRGRGCPARRCFSSEAVAKNLSVAATLEWLADMEREARNRRAIERPLQVLALAGATQHRHLPPGL